jgi:hypothetical protein
MEEIVVALRETRLGAGRVPHFTVVGGQPAGNRASVASLRGGESGTARRHGEAAHPPNGAVSTDIGDLRDGEIERLLAENARLNERIVFLFKIIEREQRRNADLQPDHTVETDRDGVVHDVKAALEAELRPVLLVLLRLVEKQHANPVTTSPAGETGRPGAARGSTPGSAFGGAVRMDRRHDR